MAKYFDFGAKLDELEERVDALLQIEDPLIEGEAPKFLAKALFDNGSYIVQDVQVPWSDAVDVVDNIFNDLQENATSLTEADIPRFEQLDNVLNKLEDRLAKSNDFDTNPKDILEL